MFVWNLLQNPFLDKSHKNKIGCSFWPSSPLCCPSVFHIPACPSSCHTTDGLGISCHSTSFWQARPHTRAHIQKTDRTRQRKRNSHLSDWLSLSLSQCCTSNKRLFLCVSVRRHKGTNRVCACEAITAFHCFFFAIHTQMQGYRHSSAVKSHKDTKQHKSLHTESMGKFLTTSRGMGGGLRVWYWTSQTRKRKTHTHTHTEEKSQI